ncbi:MAG: hypothetical protein ACRDFX_10510 [Chloroflexota bacterium]
MARRETSKDDTALAQALGLLHAYQHRRCSAYISWGSRSEQGLSPLEGDESQMIARGLLGLHDDASIRRALEEIGVERGLQVLQEVILRWKPVMQGWTVRRIFPFLQENVHNVTWLLNEIGVGITGLVLHTDIWTDWPVGIPPQTIPHVRHNVPLTPQVRWWSKFDSLTDDLGTRYLWSGSTVHMEGPLPISSGGREGMRVAQRYRESWYPGPPRSARELYLTPSRALLAQEPQSEVPPWPSREMMLSDLSYGVQVPERDGMKSWEYGFTANQTW